ncbi:hypothetical protein MHK_005221, partial [Candidatus Magnetomorum sp. HK-1]
NEKNTKLVGELYERKSITYLTLPNLIFIAYLFFMLEMATNHSITFIRLGI